MQDYQREFVEFALQCDVLKFGRFTLKSGRISPYFYNSGAFDSGAKLARLSSFYAAALVASGAQFDMLFGPAYKGIPLAAAVAVTLANEHGRDYPYAFNRKEAKDHGEGGELVGAELRGKIMIVDDVISAGTAVRESVELIRAAGAEPVGVAIALDRQERGTGHLSAIQEIEEQYSLNVVSVCNLAAISEFLVEREDMQAHLPAVREYRATYGVDG